VIRKCSWGHAFQAVSNSALGEQGINKSSNRVQIIRNNRENVKRQKQQVLMPTDILPAWRAHDRVLIDRR
jgi:hypothetical protein